MKISIILAHPNPGSFNHAIANTAADTLRRNDHQVILHDLCQEQFPPLLSALSRRRSGTAFGIRNSDFFRDSGFGIRVSAPLFGWQSGGFPA